MCCKWNRRLKSSIFNMFTGIKKFIIFGKNNIWNSATCSFENGKYLGNIIDDSVITCVIKLEKRQKQFQITLMKRKVSCKTKKIYILLAFSQLP